MLLCLWCPFAVWPSESVPVSVGVLQYGTVKWELNVVKHHQLDRRSGIDLRIVNFASKQATMIALQADSVEVSVTDWIWVSRQRNAGRPFSFIPYSTVSGALVVPADSSISGIPDLRGKRLGIAGGPIDKSWLLLRALAQKQHGIDLNSEVSKVFGAPPLLSGQIEAGRLDAVINFWHYAARLEARGMRRLLGIDNVARALGVQTQVPIIGYVFSERWSDEQPTAVHGLLEASRRAKQILLESDSEWERLRPLIKPADDTELHNLRDHFRAGIPRRWGDAERADAARLFEILGRVGGARLVGNTGTLAPGTFWEGARF